MSITPLFTAAELDEAVAALKAAYLILIAGTNKSYSVDTGLIKKTYEKRDLAELERSLAYLQQQRVNLEHGAGPQILVGRPAR